MRKDLIEYVTQEYWCSFKNDNFTLFARTLWILGATKYKHKDVLNKVTEDITVFYEDNYKQLRGFNGNQPPLDSWTIVGLNHKNLTCYIEEYNLIDAEIDKLLNVMDIALSNKDFNQCRYIFKGIIKCNCKINSYEYLINSLGMHLYNDLSKSDLFVFNQWKNNKNKKDSKIYCDYFKYLIEYFNIAISLKDFEMYLHVNEILSLINKKIRRDSLLKRIATRKSGFVLLNLDMKKYKNKVIADKDVVNSIRKHLECLENMNLQDIKDSSVVKGKTTFSGSLKIRGACVVIKNNYDVPIDFFNKILVCPLTTANDVHKYLDTMALVVDHGGILSHAAIFSRELNKPCLMGCNIATKVFNTGDIIEIDLEKEIVYKVEN